LARLLRLLAQLGRLDHSWVLMAKGLRPRLHVDWKKPETRGQFLLYRYAFDDFFAYCADISTYKKSVFCPILSFCQLQYYLQQIVKPYYWSEDCVGGKHPEKGGSRKKIFLAIS
jgi:hypothetical protein